MRRLYEDMELICKEDWIPNARDDDIEKIFSTRTFITSCKYRRTFAFEMIDPAAACSKGELQQSVRSIVTSMRSARKWMFQFSNTTALIYVVSLSSYDQVSDPNDPYKRTFNVPWNSLRCDIVRFRISRTFKIVMLNKVDLFLKKIKSVDLRDKSMLRFLDYKGGCSSSNAMTYVRSLFTKAANGGNTFTLAVLFDDSSLRVAFLYIRRRS